MVSAEFRPHDFAVPKNPAIQTSWLIDRDEPGAEFDMTQTDATRAAAKRLRELIAAGTMEVDEHELMRLADLAASPISDKAAREKLAELLIGALTVLRFAPIFGSDPENARRQAVSLLDTIELGASLP